MNRRSAIQSVIIFAAAVLLGLELSANPLEGLTAGGLKGLDASADSYDYVGNNIIARGHVVIRYQNLQVTADKAIINIETQDLEAAGDVTFASRSTKSRTVDLELYAELKKDPGQLVKLVRYTTSPTGRQMVEIEVTQNDLFMKADRAAGSLLTGTVQFKDFSFKSGPVYCVGKTAERYNNGTIIVTDAKVTTCEYIADHHEHYAIGAGKVVITPRDFNRGLFNYNPDHSDHSIWAYNTTFRLWDVPVLWFPALYKPMDTSSFGAKIEFGNSSDMGFYIRTAKDFQLLEDPFLNTNLMFDYYTERGFGYGISGDLITPESHTDFFFYGINDQNPYNYWNDDDDSDTADYKQNFGRLDIPSYRFEFKLSNVTHITPRLDFRGQIDVLSDYNFLNDYFESRYDEDIQPPTYAGLEYQFDRMSAALYTTLRINDFDSTVERLPAIQFDFPRQELFANIYYQGSTDFQFLNMRWRNFNHNEDDILSPLTELDDYSTARFDSINMFYYPIKIASWLNIIPRAGLRLTGYSRTSETDVSYEDLTKMFINDTLDGNPSQLILNRYDDNGGAQLRVAGEIGLEMNAKFYRSWQNVKNAYWELDGLRHVMVPYVNYTYIPKPTVSRDNLYYFDDTDRLDEQNFVRLGMVNRLQTRRDGKIYEWMSMENYWDFHFHNEEGYNSVGDFGTILKFEPFEGLTFSTELLLDAGQNNDHDAEAWRGEEEGYVGRPGISWNLINRWNTSISYRFAKHWRFYGSYIYSDAYSQRSIYSMGSMLTRINATSAFETAFPRSQTMRAGIEFPVFYEYTKLRGKFFVDYDVDDGLITDAAIGLSRQFHCWNLSAEAGREERRDDEGEKTFSHYFAVYLSLTAMPEVVLGGKAN